jgi:hypothetical protein
MYAIGKLLLLGLGKTVDQASNGLLMIESFRRLFAAENLLAFVP